MDSGTAQAADDLQDAGSDPISEAEAAVAALADSFVEWITEDIGRAKEALEHAKTAPGNNREDLRAIFEVVHNVKGQGGSFGYDLLTRIGGSLCDYIREATTSADEKQLKVVAAHFAAMDFVLEKKVQGDGGDIGRQLLGKIAELVANIPAPS